MELEKKVKKLINQDNRENFIYDFLLLFGTSQTTITRAKKGNLNLSKVENQLIIRKKVFFEVYNQGKSLFETKTADLLERIHTLTSDTKTYTHNPRFIIVTDFKQFLAVDTKTKETLDTPFPDLWKRTDFFLPWTGKEKYQPHLESLADVKAAEKMAKIYDEIYHNNKDFSNEYNHDLNIFLTRLLFCFFAEDTGIFPEENLFTKSLIEHTQEDASDLKVFFDQLFNALDKLDKSSYPSYIQKFPYVNGHLFTDTIHIPELTAKVRELMIDCGDNNNWKEINPDIFGSMFQAVKTAEVRSGLGQHYTSVPNIMKVINPLFMDELHEEFEKNKDNVDKLKKLQLRLKKIRIFDPACGSGNFLIIAFKQMKLLEMDIIKRVQELTGQKDFQMELSIIELKQFYGIEIDDFACEIAKLSLYLAAHQMNCLFFDTFGHVKPTLPLQESGHIVCGNALRLDWEKVCPKYIVDSRFEKEFERNALQNTPLKLDIPKEEAEVYILGNPPYIGARKQQEEQKADMDHVFAKYSKYRDLDYIACWFYLGKLYINNANKSGLAFVSTNSITQGQQVALLWNKILDDSVEINFAYQSFKWSNNARRNAGVWCCIIGLSKRNSSPKRLYCDGRLKNTSEITPYLTDTNALAVVQRKHPISSFPKMCFGDMPNDGGGLILYEEEMKSLLTNYPVAKKYIKVLLGSKEFINGQKRYCLWIKDEDLEEIKSIPPILERIEKTRTHRLNSKDKGTQKLAKRSHQFRDLNETTKYSILVPRVSSDKRLYIPMGFITKDTIVSDSAEVVYDSELWLLGVLTSHMHLVWINAVAGRLGIGFRYSAELCYNTFPFPKITEHQKKRIELCVNDILRIRQRYSDKTMAELYDPDKMPEDLLKAHQSLDVVIESCYRKRPFDNDEQRLAHLFKMYEMMTHNASEEELKQLELGV